MLIKLIKSLGGVPIIGTDDDDEDEKERIRKWLQECAAPQF